MLWSYISSDLFIRSFISLSTGQTELLNRAYANGMAALGKYEGDVKSAAAADSNFVAQHAY